MSFFPDKLLEPVFGPRRHLKCRRTQIVSSKNDSTFFPVIVEDYRLT